MAKKSEPSDARAVTDILRIPDPWAFLDGLVDFVAPPGVPFVPLAARPQLARMILVSRALYLDVDTEGIWKFLAEGEQGAHVSEMREWCHDIGAHRVTAYLAAASTHFPDGHVPEDEAQRMDCLMALEEQSSDPLRQLDQEFQGAIDEWAECLRAYLRSHEAELATVIATPTRL